MQAHEFKISSLMQALTEARSLTDAQWIDAWVEHSGTDSIFLPREIWIDYLKECVILELEKEMKQ